MECMAYNNNSLDELPVSYAYAYTLLPLPLPVPIILSSFLSYFWKIHNNIFFHIPFHSKLLVKTRKEGFGSMIHTGVFQLLKFGDWKIFIYNFLVKVKLTSTEIGEKYKCWAWFSVSFSTNAYMYEILQKMCLYSYVTDTTTLIYKVYIHKVIYYK